MSIGVVDVLKDGSKSVMKEGLMNGKLLIIVRGTRLLYHIGIAGGPKCDRADVW